MTLKTLMMSAAISALIAGHAVAQTDTTDTAAPEGSAVGTADVGAAGDTAVAPEFTSISEMTVGDLVGQNVYEPTGKTIGDIDYVVGRDGGALAVIGIGGFLGLGEYTVAVPLDEFGYDASQQMVTLDTTKDALKERAEFDESDVESLPDETPLADLVAGADAGGSPAMTDDVGTDATGIDDSAAPDVDAGTDDGMAADDTADPADPATDMQDAPADNEMTAEEPAEEGEAVTTE